MTKKKLCVVFVLLVGMTLALGAQTLQAGRTTTAPILDGRASDSVWAKANSLSVSLEYTPYKPNNGYEGMSETDVVMKAVYDSRRIYILVQWDDPTKSLERFPWTKQSDRSWKQLKNTDSTGHENTYYEDKLAILWDISTPLFANAGCAITCHMNAISKSAGRKYTPSAGQTVDMWHWKGVRTAPVNQIDDQYIDHNTDPAVNSGWGRHGDTKTGGGYVNNIEDGKIKWQDSGFGKVRGDKYWILDDAKKLFADTYAPGDQVAGIIVSPFTGPRGDIDTVAEWDNGKWTLEIARDLVTTGQNSETQDVQFRNLSKNYPFGIAVFDNSQINHIFHWGVLNLSFQR